jgi:hypothetical protein
MTNRSFVGRVRWPTFWGEYHDLAILKNLVDGELSILPEKKEREML